MSTYQQNQIVVINAIEKQIAENNLQFSTVARVENFDEDPRLCLTSVHFPSNSLIGAIQEQVIKPLQSIQPTHYYYPPESFHMTIKNIRVVQDPPDFTQNDIKKAESILAHIVPLHKKVPVYFYRLLLFPNNLALIGTTDESLDDLILDLDKELSANGIADNKKYTNSQYFFCNMTLVRFTDSLSEEFIQKVDVLSKKINIDPYVIDSVSLITSNAVMKKRTLVNAWQLL
jgi:2'-5' RNA ligase